MSVLVAIWGFLNSPAGQTLIVAPLLAWFVKKFGKSKRAEQVAHFALLAFEAVEPMPIPGADKYKRAVSGFVDLLREAGLGMPTAQEMRLLQEMAKHYAMARKSTVTQGVLLEKTIAHRPVPGGSPR